MSPVCRGTSGACINSCWSNLSAQYGIPEPNHEASSATSLLPEGHFTNHESLPTLIHALSNFIEANPQYATTELADHIRDREYRHLFNHICFDYIGLGLFSHAQLSSPVQFSHSTPPFFNISYMTANLRSQLQHENPETALESAIKRRIMSFLKISDEEYTMVCTANKTSAFKTLAESYPFHANRRLITVYDHESDAVGSMVESAKKRGARAVTAEFRWPSMKINSEKLEKMVKKKNKKIGLFVFPPQSQMTGTMYPYQWMSLAQEYGWHVVLDACSLGPKEMDSLGLSLIRPDFIVCSFFKIYGEDPSGFAGLFIKRSSRAILEMPTADNSVGIISIIPPFRPSNLPGDIFVQTIESLASNIEVISPFSDPRSARSPPTLKLEEGEIQELYDLMHGEKAAMGESSRNMKSQKSKNALGIECRYLDHADTAGLLLTSRRVSCLGNWLVNALMKLKHPRTEDGIPLVRLYGSQLKLIRGSALAMNLFDWRGEKIEPALVQKLADRSNISLSCGFIKNICFSVTYEEDKSIILGKRLHNKTVLDDRKEENADLGITVVNVSISFLNNFEDVYRLWSFIAKFLDADFIEKARWRYTTLRQTVVEV